MNAQRILKEARPLFWPWCAVALAGALPLLRPLPSMAWISQLGFFLGIPLLATLSLGNEFQHRTLSLLLSQPVGRMEIWGEKLSVTVVAVLSAALIFFLAWRGISFYPGGQELAFAGAWIVASTASATFWTLFTRSTVGGVALNIGVQSFISFVVPWANLADGLRARGYLSPGNPIVVSPVTFVFLCYAGVMVWLGGRMLARFQAKGGMGGDDLLIAGPDVLPGALAGWLRCRPTGAVLNLFRKEFRLLRPVWLITLLAALAWSCLTLFESLHQRGSIRNLETAAVIVGVVSTLMIAILAGTLSLGEERTSGTHAWHLTLPVPARRQWRIKLFVALLAGFVGAGLLPVLIAGRLFGPSRLFNLGTDWLLVVVLLTFASFWCACAVNGTVRAVLWVFPVMITLYFAVELGRWVGSALTDLYVSRFDPFADMGFTNTVLSWTWDYKHSAPDRLAVYLLEPSYQPMLTLIWTPTLVLAAIQSYRLFRAQLQDSTRSLIRNLLPLAMVALLCNSVCMVPRTLVDHAIERNWTVLSETFKAIGNIQPGAVKPDAAHPLQLTVEDLAKASPLSESTRRWLRGSHVTIVPIKFLPHRNPADARFHFDPDDSHSWYLATIYLAGGSDCTQSSQHWNRDVRMLVVICK